MKLPLNYESYKLYDEDADLIAAVFDEANAEFIVKACNEYHPLIRVVKALVAKLDADVWFLETAKNEGICVESIKQIIKQAEGEE